MEVQWWLWLLAGVDKMKHLGCAILRVVNNAEARLGCYTAASFAVVQLQIRLVVEMGIVVVLMAGVRRLTESL